VTNRADRWIDVLEAIIGPARWVAVGICGIPLFVLAIVGAWPYALFGGFVVAGLVVKIRRQDRARDQLGRTPDT